MNIKILSDSTCDLSGALIEQHNITLVPLRVIKNDKSFLDGVTITPAEIFDHVASGGSLCSTTAVNVDEYAHLFEKYSRDYDGIILINIGSGFSSCYQNACIAAEDYPKVRVIDSSNLSTGQGLVVLKAAELAANCDDLDAIAETLREYTNRVEASFVLDRLDYMVKGGRCSAVTALGANLLGLKPCIEVKDGKMSVVKKYRGNHAKCLASYICDRLDGRTNALENSTLFLTYTQVSEDALTSAREGVAAHAGYFKNVYETVAGCTVSCHCGPGTLGILFVRK